jgi:hypothetical protein
LDARRQAQKAVARQKKHRDDARDEVELAHHDAALGDDEGGDNADAGLVGGTVALAEEAGHHAVLGQGLQVARSAQQAADGRGKGGGEDAGDDQGSEAGHAGPDHVVAAQHFGIDGVGEENGNGDVDGQACGDGGDGAPGDGAARVFEIAGHGHASGEAGDRRKEDREDRFEGGAVALEPEVGHAGGGRRVGVSGEQRKQRQDDGRQDDELHLEGQVGGDEGEGG